VSVAVRIGASAETVGKWVRRAEEILKAAAAAFGAEFDRAPQRW
jgi:hypothetical protein